MGITYDDVNKDLAMVITSLSDARREVISSIDLVKLSSVIPFFSFIVSCVSLVLLYLSTSKADSIAVTDFFVFYFESGWYVTLAVVVAGLILFIMSYFNLMTYMAIPETARKNSIILCRVRGLVKKTVLAFFVINVMLSLLTLFEPMFVFSAPIITFLFLFIINGVVSIQVSRYGMGVVLEKLSSVLNKL